ncbi:MAG: AAA family ATPase [Candidatus Sulfotelmatobacter sp.]
MRIESVMSVAFGPFRDAILEFSPGLTVIYGANEAGKSRWHAAIYAALCGMRRGRGQPRLEDRLFTDLHRPWSGDTWEVRAFVRLDDGRRIELRQNLMDLAHCSATDADLGRDVSGEILNDGTPDAARWLGLDRQSFLSVACVRQAEIQAIADNVELLQGELQRAAASAARDATAAEAIDRLENFFREQVGQDRANSTKPLQRAKVNLAAVEAAVANAHEKHVTWLTVEADALKLRKNADDEERRLQVLQALGARREADAVQSKVNRARELAEKYPKGPVPPLPHEDLLAGDVTAALSEWEKRPEVPVLVGPSAEAIREEIQSLPSMPTGDLTLQPEVAAARKAYERATQALELHQQQQPLPLPRLDAKGLTADQLREVARALEILIPSVDSGLEKSYEQARARLEVVQHSSESKLLVAALAATAVIVGAGLWAFLYRLIGAALVITGVTTFIWLVFRSSEARRMRALEGVRAIEAQVLSQRKALEDAREQVNVARTRTIELGLPTDSKALRELADGLVLMQQHQEIVADWSRTHEVIVSNVVVTKQALEHALEQRGIVVGTEVLAAYQQYECECQSRAEQAARASRCELLDHQLSDREAAEQAARDAEARRSRAWERILATLARCGLKAHDQATAIEELRGWQTAHQELLMNFDEATREYAELEALLAGGPLADLASQSEELQGRAEALNTGLGGLPELATGMKLDEEVHRAEKVARDAVQNATATEAQAHERSKGVPSVAEAEEAFAAAQSESERVGRLGRTLTLALDFLRRAEERVHRDIAPVLAAGLRQWLADVTQGRYTDARVDPSNLSVQVLGPDHQWRDAHRLSHGTAEQIYLLLRIVLADLLVTAGETCPLLLDDVLVQSDRVRKQSLLNVIAAVSRVRQVILLTQEEEVRQWAQQHLVEPDRVVSLSEAVIS